MAGDYSIVGWVGIRMIEVEREKTNMKIILFKVYCNMESLYVKLRRLGG